MGNGEFDIVVSRSTISPEDWARALRARDSELPELTTEQKNVARGFKISREEYARGELARLYGQARMMRKARDLGNRIKQAEERKQPWLKKNLIDPSRT